MYLDNFQYQNNQALTEQFGQPISDFEGYSTIEMQNILHYPFEPNSPLGLQKLSAPEYQKIPMLNQMRYFLDIIQKTGPLKLTTKGFLPTKIVKEIYSKGFIEEPRIESNNLLLYKEKDSMTVNLTRLLAELSGLTKKRNGKLSLTRAGEKTATDNHTLLTLLLKTFTTRFNWAYYDGYGDNRIGQFGYGFSLILLHKYGTTKQLDIFYAERYFKAIPALRETKSPTEFITPEKRSYKCYSLRTFDRFLDYFGLIKIETVGEKWFPDKFITKTILFDKLIKVSPHNAPF